MKKDLRAIVTRRMLREGMLRCLETKTLSRITVSDLCRESGINRTTFYNHYEQPAMILREIAREYADGLFSIYRQNVHTPGVNDERALEMCLDYLYTRRDEIRVLFSENAEHCLSGFGLEIIVEEMKKKAPPVEGTPEKSGDAFLAAVTTAAAVFGLIQLWVMMDIDRTPKDLVGVLKKAIPGTMFE